VILEAYRYIPHDIGEGTAIKRDSNEGSDGMTVEVSRLEGDHGDEELVGDITIKSVGIPIKEVRVLARLEDI
jgi:hypothetical protein